MHKPEILAPAGDETAFLAALAAGADAIYLGLKHFSARMEADNFSISDLARLTSLASGRNCRVYVAMNTLVKPGEPEAAGRLIDRLARQVNPAGLIVQDPAIPALARQAGFNGEIHLSTLANVSHPMPLEALHRDMGVDRVVLPRELNIDEMKKMARACPEGLSLEVFVHGALCFNVSGRCWWSSYMGGKSGLRGRCVQPCRRVYSTGSVKARSFSCKDLSLDVLARSLLDIPEISAWKIEGRKKGAHYVYYTVSAYRLLRDHPKDPEAKKTALGLLEQALGRPGTHYTILPQKPQDPVDVTKATGSGMYMGKTMGTPDGKLFLRPRMPLIPGDLLRLGYQDQPGHRTLPIRTRVPKGGRLDLPRSRGRRPDQGLPVFLIDRREPELSKKIRELKNKLADLPATQAGPSDFTVALPKRAPKPKGRSKAMVMCVRRTPPKGRFTEEPALWLAPGLPKKLPKPLVGRVWWWLPPVIWPNEERQWHELVMVVRKAGATRFMLGAPWQASLFKDEIKGRGRLPELWAGPTCNIANALAVQALADMGFTGAVASPELSRDDALELPQNSPLPLGYVTHGQWPVGLTRAPATAIKTEKPLSSPMNEVFWTRKYGQNTWIYPIWGLDLRNMEAELSRSGYRMFVHFSEPKPRAVPKAERFSQFNWNLQLL